VERRHALELAIFTGVIEVAAQYDGAAAGEPHKKRVVAGRVPRGTQNLYRAVVEDVVIAIDELLAGLAGRANMIGVDEGTRFFMRGLEFVPVDDPGGVAKRLRVAGVIEMRMRERQVVGLFDADHLKL